MPDNELTINSLGLAASRQAPCRLPLYPRPRSDQYPKAFIAVILSYKCPSVLFTVAVL
jgi:hypothetical protein